MLTYTLDTSPVIHAAQPDQQLHDLANELVDLARDGKVRLSLTTAYERDQRIASPVLAERNRAWLANAPILGPVPGPFRLDYSELDGPDVLIDDWQAAFDDALREILLPAELRVQFRALELDDRQIRRIHDVHHLSAHLLAGHDAFVTEDRGILKQAAELERRTGVRTWDIAAAVAAVSA